MPHPHPHHGHYIPDRRFYRPNFHYPGPDDDTSMEDITTMLLVATVAIIALRR